MVAKSKKIITPKTTMPQIALLFSQFLFLAVLIGCFSLISLESFPAYERSISPLHIDGAVSSLYD